MPTPIILVVEDIKTGRSVLKKLLETYDYEVHLVSSGEEALAAMALTKYAGVLMDISLLGMDGCDCTRQIRRIEVQSGGRTPVVALTGRTDQHGRDAAKEAGMDDYLSKPFESEEVRRILLRYVYEPKYPNLKILRPTTEELDQARRRRKKAAGD